MELARVLLEVTGGMVPGQPMEDFGRVWAITTAEWQEATGAGGQLQLLLDCYADAQMYALKLAIDSASGLAPNWIRFDWIWL
jgi:hypothetical protein